MFAEQHNAHVHAWRNIPLAQRIDYVRYLHAECVALLNDSSYVFPGADAYYACKDEERKYAAILAGKSRIEHDPMHFWFGMQSN